MNQERISPRSLHKDTVCINNISSTSNTNGKEPKTILQCKILQNDTASFSVT